MALANAIHHGVLATRSACRTTQRVCSSVHKAIGRQAHSFSPLTAVTSIDGRYANQTAALAPFFSEFALIKARVTVELQWLQALADAKDIPEVSPLTAEDRKVCEDIIRTFDVEQAKKVKDIEKKTNHDVKAVEYFIKDALMASGSRNLSRVSEFIHFGCTSEDINNLAYAILVKEAMSSVMVPTMTKVHDSIATCAEAYAHLSMLSRTHGQPATPTTLGKEFANFAYRLGRQIKQVKSVEILGKFSGAVGNFAAHTVVYPGLKWEALAAAFVGQRLGITYNPYCTQIEPHDWLAELFHGMSRYNSILLSFDRDMWGYISLGYFTQKIVAGEVGSSTMPHKVNPIDFENSEGNLGLANATFGHLAEKLPISRWQRDLSDSTVLRSIGSGFAHSIVSYQSTLKGIGKLQVDQTAIENDLNGHPEVLGEAIQTVMRRYGAEAPYERLKDLTRGQGSMRAEKMRAFLNDLSDTIPAPALEALKALTPVTYVGLSAQQATSVKAKSKL